MLKYRLYKILRFFHLISKKKYKARVATYLYKKSVEYKAIANSKLFDPEWYLSKNPDVKTAGIDPIEHYLKCGWKEKRQRTPYFNEQKYIETYSDVAKANIAPLLHWEIHGKNEGRSCDFSNTVFIEKNCSCSPKYKNIKDGILDIDTIKKIISSDTIKVVSFDIFDTLLLRPVINPTDLFYLIHNKVKKQYNIDFLKYRLNAENELNNPFANIEDIYNHIKNKYKLSDKDILLLKNEELNCEKQLLSKRDDIFELYKYAVKIGKKVIATSDMYLPSSFLCDVLKRNDYTEIDKVYVSNEYNARKDSGELYAIVQKEQNTSQLLHIGDNYISDYKKAIEQNITAIYYPSIKDIILSDNSIYKNVWDKGISPDPMCRILLGFTLNSYFKNLKLIKNQPAIYADFEALVRLSIAPVIFYIANSIANNEDIQNSYEQILFASRDGYLPRVGYDILSKYREIKPSKYVYAGRRAYFSSQYASFMDLVHSLEICKQQSYLIEDLLNCYINDKDIVNNIISELSEEEKKLDFNKNKQEIISVLERFQIIINEYSARHKIKSIEYYNDICGSNNREIIFDCGYSGSISVALSNILNKPVDKIYLWETNTNKQSDEKNKTKTYLLMNETKMFVSQHLIYEELFSPLEGSCIGFNDKKPLLENLSYSQEMEQNYTSIKSHVNSYINNFCEIMKSYLPFFDIYDTLALQKLLINAVTISPFNELLLLDNIKFSDAIYLSTTQSLSYKVQKYLEYNNPFFCSGFTNSKNKIYPSVELKSNNFKIGIHIHLYNVYLYNEFLYYLRDFPQKFDLIITFSNDDKTDVIRNLFNKKLIPHLNNLIVKIVENRGRDVAPWLITIKNIQSKYDLFCHVQSKESSYISWGNEWRRYLLHNTLEVNIVKDIINIFYDNKNLGCIFPDFYNTLKKTYYLMQGHLLGENGEEQIMQNLIYRMGFDYNVSRLGIHFSGGTMMWYRPKALQPLFDLNFKLEEFPPEPIGIGGTIAHAIERLPALVCKLNGYEAKEYTKYEN